MFRIVDSYGDPLKFPARLPLEPGHIVSIENSTDSLLFSLANSRNPFGVVSEVDGYGVLSVFCSMIIFQTDKFETDQSYKKGDLLYSNNQGIFTTRKEEDNSLLLGMVNDGYLDNGDYIEIRLI